MPNLLDIRRRIKSVKNTQQITKAMKMVSAAKLKRAQDRVVTARPFANKMAEVLGELAKRTDEDFHHPLLDERGDQHYLLVLITADKGLCGGFNANLGKAAQHFIRENPDKQIELITIGRRGRDFFRRRRAAIVSEYINLTARSFEHEDAAEIAREIMRLFTAEDSTIDRVFVIYMQFKSVLSQQIVRKQLLPVPTNRFTDEGTGGSDVLIDYIYEQPPAEIFGALLPNYVETELFTALVDSVASEQVARMTA